VPVERRRGFGRFADDKADEKLRVGKAHGAQRVESGRAGDDLAQGRVGHGVDKAALEPALAFFSLAHLRDIALRGADI